MLACHLALFKTNLTLVSIVSGPKLCVPAIWCFKTNLALVSIVSGS
jgi:hypothetical protein